MGLTGLILQNPWALSSMPNLSARPLKSGGGFNPTDNTTKSNSSSFTPPSGEEYRMDTFLVSGFSLAIEVKLLINRTPGSFSALW